jgi:hypothetical protein
MQILLLVFILLILTANWVEISRTKKTLNRISSKVGVEMRKRKVFGLDMLRSPKLRGLVSTNARAQSIEQNLDRLFQADLRSNDRDGVYQGRRGRRPSTC